MNEIKCPNCGEVFQVDEAGYAEIVAQVRNEQFEKEVTAQIKAVKEQQEERQEKLLMAAEGKHKLELAKKDQEIAELRTQANNAEAIRKQEVEAVQAKADMLHHEELEKKNQEIIQLKEQAKSAEAVRKQELEAVKAKAEMQRKDELAEKEQQIQELEAKAKSAEVEKQLAVAQAVQGKEAEIAKLQAKVTRVEQEAEIRELGLKETHRVEVEGLKEALAQSKDFRRRLNNKMIGENLEQHCLTVFNRARADAFPNAIFGKDNDSVDHTKGDFIFRESTDDGIEFLSIMFEMKNEDEETVKKQKNSKFLAKLDEDRRKKNCEYAVLVTTLEPDNDYYNDGIVTAYQYEKMIIIRPQFFLPLISILRRAALASIETRRELIQIQRENMDVQKFDETLRECRSQFEKNVGYAQGHFEKVIKEINATIDHLTNVRDELEMTGKQLGQANKKVQDLTIKKLTKGNIGMQQKFLDAGIDIAG